MKKHQLTFEEDYALGYARGYRLGRIKSSREILLRVTKICGEEEGVKPSKSLIQKIKRETDHAIMGKIIIAATRGNISLAELDAYFDMFFRTKEELENNKYSAYGAE